MAEFKLNQGDVVSLKVTGIRFTGKEVTKQDGLYYQYYLVLENKLKETIECEYLSPLKDQDKFFLGVQQFIKVNYLSKRGTPEISPCDELPSPVKIVAGNDHTILDAFENRVPTTNCYSVPVNGTSISVALHLAKDILVAEIGTTDLRKVTDDDIKRMIGWSDLINTGICERIKS